MVTKLESALPIISKFFETQTEKIYKKSELRRVLQENYKGWQLSDSTSLKAFIEFLVTQRIVEIAVLEFPSRKETRYLFDSVSNYSLASSLKSPSYFSHYSAAFLHELTEQIPKTIYVNQEQSPKPKPTQQLEQGRINFAFNQSPRVTKNKAIFKDTTITLLNWKFTNEAGVERLSTSFQGNTFRVTNIERTLIDCCVRPVYSGGIFEVLKAFSRARDIVSIPKLANLLKQLDYTYPYHQVIGFYLEKAKYSENSQEIILSQFEYQYDFYLTHKIKKPKYSEKWRLFYPEGF